MGVTSPTMYSEAMHGSQNTHSPEMTKPPEGGLPPQEHLT
jgi:hypothetical protein